MDEVVQEQTDEGVQEPTGVDEEPSEKSYWIQSSWMILCKCNESHLQ